MTGLPARREVVTIGSLRLVALALCSLLAACTVSTAAEPPPVLHGDVAFSLEEREAIEVGNAWLADHVGAPRYVIAWDLPHADVYVPAPYTISRVELGTKDLLFEVGGIPACIELGPLRPDLLTRIAAHEFGHARLLPHTTSAGLMFPSVPEMHPGVPMPLAWSNADEASCVAVGVCR